MRAWSLAGLAAAVLLAGCFSEVLPAGPATKLEFICGVLDPAESRTVAIEAWRSDGLGFDPDGAERALVDELGEAGARRGGVSLSAEEGLRIPGDGWDTPRLLEWLDDRPFSAGGEARLFVLWVPALPGGASHAVPAPGVVAVAADAVATGALRLGVPAADVARAVLLHAAGHALGAVNQGIPVQDPEIQEREGPAGHDPDPASVLHAGWEHAEAMAWAEGATYAAFPAWLHADWDAAVRDGGVCAA